MLTASSIKTICCNSSTLRSPQCRHYIYIVHPPASHQSPIQRAHCVCWPVVKYRDNTPPNVSLLYARRKWNSLERIEHSRVGNKHTSPNIPRCSLIIALRILGHIRQTTKHTFVVFGTLKTIQTPSSTKHKHTHSNHQSAPLII